MLLAEILNSVQFILLGLSLLIFGFVLRRGVARGRRSAARDVYVETKVEMARREQQSLHGIQQLEIRLHDFDREVRGRVDTTLTLLEQLMGEADREGQRLMRLLREIENAPGGAAARQPDIVGPRQTVEVDEVEPASVVSMPLSAPIPLLEEQQRSILDLADAGYSAGQIARLLEKPLELVELVLQRRPGRRAA